MAWNEAAITESGLSLLAKTFDGGSIILTRAVGGEGYIPKEQLPQQTSIAAPVHELGIADVQAAQGKINVSVQGQNNGVGKAYLLKQIGIFAKGNGSDDEILFAIIQDEIGEVIPAIKENPEFLIEFDFVIPVSNADNIQVVISSSLYALKKDLVRLVSKQEIIIPTTNWKAQEEGGLYNDILLDNVTEDMTPIVSIHPTHTALAARCGMNSGCMSFDGGIRLYAQKAPTAEISASLLLLRAYSSNVYCGESSDDMAGIYELPIATATQIGGIKIGEGIKVKSDGTAYVDVAVAPLENAKKIIDEVFNT